MARQIDIQIYGRSFRVACPAGAEEALATAVERVNAEIDQIANDKKSAAIENLVVLAAINLVGEISEQADIIAQQEQKIIDLNKQLADITQETNKKEYQFNSELNDQIKELNAKIDSFLL